jgi:hypothetical protein
MLESILLINLKQLSADENQQNGLSSWVMDKKFKPTDFPVLNLLKTDDEKSKMFGVFLKCKSLNASFSETVQLIELTAELILINVNLPILNESENLTQWKTHLQKLRYPQTTSSDEALKTKFEKLPWPTGAKTKFERRGDRAGVELKLFVTSQADLTKVISALERVKEQL